MFNSFSSRAQLTPGPWLWPWPFALGVFSWWKIARVSISAGSSPAPLRYATLTGGASTDGGTAALLTEGTGQEEHLTTGTSHTALVAHSRSVTFMISVGDGKPGA